MSNRRFLNNNAIAKIQIILVFAMVLLFGNSCERKDLYLRVNGIQIEVEMYDVRLDLLWGIDWETEWQYTWNESAADFGTIGYTKPELVKGTIYNVDSYTGKRYSFGDKPGPQSKRLFDTLRGIQYGEIEDKHGWTTVVIE